MLVNRFACWSLSLVLIAQVLNNPVAVRAQGTAAATAPAAGRPAEGAAGVSTKPADVGPSSGVWRPLGSKPADDAAANRTDTQPPLRAVASRPSIARVTNGPGTLPNDAGQVWRDYDISPYTARVTSTARPEQAVVDWILRETGYEAWHSEPLGVLSANKRTLRVYHTPEMQAVVGEMVDRFVNSEAESQAFSLHVVSIGSPTWRSKSQRMLRPVSAMSQGVQAWLLAKEDAALLMADLHKRTDFREHTSPHLVVNNGQSTIITTTRPKNYVRDVLLRGDAWPGFEPQMTQLEEGFSLEFNPLLAIDGRTIDAVIKCNIDQVEKMIPVMLDVPTPVAPRQRTKIEVPQLSSCRLQERFRWPADQVLLISLGMVAAPVSASPGPLALTLPGTAPSRADLLIFVENRGKASPSAATARSTRGEASAYRGRY